MKKITLLAFLVVFFLLIPNSLAQVLYYRVDIDLDGNDKSFVNMTIEFDKPETNFNFDVLGKVENFNATNELGDINCDLETSGVSSISCNFNSTEEKKAIRLSFETSDFVRTLGTKNYFDADLSLEQNITQVHVSLTLPQGMGLVETNKTTSRVSFPDDVLITGDGRRVIMIWQLSNVTADQQLRFQTLFENMAPSPITGFVGFGAALIIGVIVIVVLSSIIVLRYVRKPEKLVLSVLDDFERKVMDIVMTSNGSTDQKKIVQDTNLSKAKISRVVKNLLNRGLIEVERTGRTNKIKIVKKRLGF